MGEKKNVEKKKLIKSLTSIVPDPRASQSVTSCCSSPMQVWFEQAGKSGLGSVGDRKGAEKGTDKMNFGLFESASCDEMNFH